MSDRGPDVLVAGRLHISSVLLKVAQRARRMVIVVLALGYQALAGDDATISTAAIAALAFVGVATTVFPIIEWRRFRYQLTARELTLNSGLLRLHERRIPVGHIQDLTTEVGPVYRLFGVAKVTVQTSSTQTAEATLDAVTAADASVLVEALRRVTRRAVGAPEDSAAAPSPTLAEASLGQLVLRGLTDNRAGIMLATGFGLLDQVAGDNVDVYRAVFGVLRARIETTFGAGTAAVVTAVTLLAVAFVVAGYLTSTIVNVFLFSGFKVTERDGVFHRTYGLVTKRSHALPRERIQVLRIEQNLGRRAVGLAEMRTDDMGAGAHDKTAQGSGTHVFVPIGRHDELMQMAERVLPGLDASRSFNNPISRRVIRRWAARGLLAGVVLALPLTWALGPVGLLALALVLPGWLWGRLVYRSVRWSIDGSYFAAQWGVLLRRIAFIPIARAQGVALRTTPLDRLSHVATVTVVAGGGASVSLHHMEAPAASALAEGVMSAVANGALRRGPPHECSSGAEEPGESPPSLSSGFEVR
jgi:putative membrane protein